MVPVDPGASSARKPAVAQFLLVCDQIQDVVAAAPPQAQPTAGKFTVDEQAEYAPAELHRRPQVGADPMCDTE